jgi:hypothetical protein
MTPRFLLKVIFVKVGAKEATKQEVEELFHRPFFRTLVFLFFAVLLSRVSVGEFYANH